MFRLLKKTKCLQQKAKALHCCLFPLPSGFFYHLSTDLRLLISDLWFFHSQFLNSPIPKFLNPQIQLTEIIIVIKMTIVIKEGCDAANSGLYPCDQGETALLDLIRRIKESDEAIAITKNGVPEAILMSMRKFEGLLETLDILSDEKAMSSIRKSIRQAQKGTWVDFDEVFAE